MMRSERIPCFLLLLAGLSVAIRVFAFSSSNVVTHRRSSIIDVISQQRQRRRLWMNQEQHSSSGEASPLLGIPTMEQLQKDPFPKQIQHAEFVMGLLEEDQGRETEVLMKRLRAQLSHAAGIRGFMATYLTTIASDDKGDDTRIPLALVKAVEEQILLDTNNDLIPLMCMNVIMPTAMMTTYQDQDPELAQQSSRTATRATHLLRNILLNSPNDPRVQDPVKAQCQAILAAATTTEKATSTKEEDLRQYWIMFFEKWGYESKQLSDIAEAIRAVLP